MYFFRQATSGALGATREQLGSSAVLFAGWRRSLRASGGPWPKPFANSALHGRHNAVRQNVQTSGVPWPMLFAKGVFA